MAKNFNGRPSKSFQNGSNHHFGASRSQSGMKNYGFSGNTRNNKKSSSNYGSQSSLTSLLLGNEQKKKNKKSSWF